MGDRSEFLEVRRGKELDLDRIIEMSKEVQKEGEPFLPPVIDDYARENLRKIIEVGILLVAEYEGEIIGVLGLKPVCPMWNPKAMQLQNSLFHVSGPFRHTGAADALIKTAKDIVKDIPDVLLLITIGSFLYPELKDRYMRSRGGKYVGGTFLFHGGGAEDE